MWEDATGRSTCASSSKPALWLAAVMAVIWNAVSAPLLYIVPREYQRGNVAAPVVPLMALIIAGLAGNQVEGFAVMKGAGFLLMGPLASFFLPRPWDLLVGVLPTYWPIKAYFAAAEGAAGLFWAAVAVSLVYPAPWVVILYRRLRRRAMAG